MPKVQIEASPYLRKTCGVLRISDSGSKVDIRGWVHRRRDQGALIFIDVRDRDGITQIVLNREANAEAHRTAEEVRPEFVVQIEGVVQARGADRVNPNLDTGEIEVVADKLIVLNRAKTLPFEIASAVEADENLRLKYRYLDLRRPRMQRNMILRHKVVKFIRDYLDERGFLEIETPMLSNETPEGARSYLVPSRVNPGEFYALPQSPQQLKQLLMVAGIGKYFQIARCLRDEDLRADRQPEFTQLDLEMSFVEREDVLQLTEGLLTAMTEAVGEKQVKFKPFPRITYAESMARFGNDKPDLRYGLELCELSDVFAESSFAVFSGALASGGSVVSIRIPGGGSFTRRELDELTETAKRYGAGGLVWLAIEQDGTLRGPAAKFLSARETAAVLEATAGRAGDLLLVVADVTKVAREVLSRLRSDMARKLNLIDENELAYAWIVDPPLFEWNYEEKRWDAQHHPFTSAMPEDAHLLGSDPGKVRAAAYDVVCNGYELSSGSIRIHEREMQSRIFEIMGYTQEEISARFGHLLAAFEYGAPPHGGIAPGIDRIVMLLAGEENIREVMAFPKTAQARDLMLGSPSPVTERALKELHIKLDTRE